MVEEKQYTDLKREYENLREEFHEYRTKYFINMVENAPPMNDRVADLELKMARLWDILTEKTKDKKDIKPSKFASRRFKGRL